MRVRVLVASSLMLTGGCVTARPATLDGGPFASLWDRDLPGFEQRIALERRREGEQSADVALAEAWSRLINCRPIGPAPAAIEHSRIYRALFETLRFEELRHERVLTESQPGRSDALLRATWFATLHDESFFRREPDPTGSEVMHWLPSDEAWLDELPAPRSVVSACPALLERVSFSESPTDPNRLRLLIDEQRGAAELAAIAETHSAQLAPIALTAFRARRHEAWLAYQRMAYEHTAAGRALRQAEAFAAVEALFSREVPPTVSAQTEAEARLLASLVVEGLEASEPLDWVGPAADLPLDEASPIRWAVRYRILSLARRGNRLALAQPLANELPPREHPLYDAYAYEVARLAFDAEELGVLLRVATSALRDRPSRGNRFREATLSLALRRLTSTPFDERTVELVEDLGPRARTHARMEWLANLALDEGQPAMLEASAQWLVDRHVDARARRRFYVLRALAAFLRDDPAGFERWVGRVTHAPAALRRAIGSRRGPAFFHEQHRALTRLLGELLPRLAEWPDDVAGRARRRRWLNIVVRRIQAFLRVSPTSREREPLTELYRVASAMLSGQARSYPERVAAREASPMVLGRVRTSRQDPELARIDLTLTPPYAFAILPRTRMPQTWTFGFGGVESDPPARDRESEVQDAP